ncbi:MAG: glycylpeptide N-tetradecanoyltransferase [Chrysothrix sp. TS-e1954]|nr:MAG: glycylpeptide N-tetradecanoyltransferase [Chrysothrix sp. TS-e1954]
MTSNDGATGSSQDETPTGVSGESSKDQGNALEALKKLNIKDMGKFFQAQDGASKEHKFWKTQPVPQYDEQQASQPEDGPIEPEDINRVPKEPYPLLAGFDWVTMDLEDGKEVDDVYQLLFDNYVEDQEAMFRFKYSPSFLNWALKSPGWRKEWHVGIRAAASRKLVAFISAVPITLRVKSRDLKSSEVNFLCIHKKLRSKRLAPLLIREVTRRINLVGIWQAIYTAGTFLPTPVSTCRYYHRSLDWPKLNDVGFSPLPHGSTRPRQMAKYKLPATTSTTGLRPMTSKDVPAVRGLLKKYLDQTQMAQQFSEDELQHWVLDNKTPSLDKVVWSYVVETKGKITDFFSFYCLESTVIGHQRHKTIRAAYLFYYASEVALVGDGKDKTALKKRLNELINDALILAKQENFDVFNALTLLDNPLFLQDQRFGPGDGKLHYYLYNYRTSAIPGGTDDKMNLDDKRMGGVGMVML